MNRRFISLLCAVCLSLSISASAQASGNWSPEKTITGTDDVLVKFEKLYGIKPLTVENAYYNLDGITVQINTVTTKSNEESVNVAERMSVAVRGTHPIIARGSEVIEIRANDVWAQQRALAHYDATGLQPVLLDKSDVPADWKLEMLVFDNTKSAAMISARMKLPVRAIANQIFAVGGQKVQINYIKTANDPDKAKVIAILKESGQTGRAVLSGKQGTPVEIIANNDNLLKQAKELFDKP